MGSPGCPEFAFWTASADRKRIVLIHVWSSVEVCAVIRTASRPPEVGQAYPLDMAGQDLEGSGCKDARFCTRGRAVILRTRLHWITWSGTIGFVLFVGLVVGLLLSHNELAPDPARRIVAWGTVIAVGALVARWVRWRRVWVEITADRFRIDGNLWRRQGLDVAVTAVASAEADVPWVGRLLGYGTVTVVAEGRRIPIRHVPDAERVAGALGKLASRRR